MSEIIGIVEEMYVHPVKSMTGQLLREAQIESYGLYGDRARGLVRADNPDRFVTITQVPQLAAYRAEQRIDASHPGDWPEITIYTPDERAYRWEDEEWLAELEQLAGIKLLRWEAPNGYVPKGAIEDGDLLLTTSHSLAALSSLYGAPIDIRRFRPNLHLRLTTTDAAAYLEGSWRDHQFLVGETVIQVTGDCPRCSIINVEPLSGLITPHILKHVARQNAIHFGVYASVKTPGLIRVGDTIRFHTSP
ncbi:MOSC domain-containing protein [Paenibacillus sp. ACRRX]|uniref:MOSC domain-containing protein n=1 Tax=unclassified Paenibacillus TaxID=185978 RepID=UPI001EF70AB6|nr:MULTISPECIES: MOSC domain-containing protein [unclassified Paenibacillus]MCG7408610.1 MOSC domain-containing protein [Paenibacillus sp. ACRRX]MDK8182855.1 MOSC domain-containing protein [Paenibacillus sp. UMB4589-SE434]